MEELKYIQVIKRHVRKLEHLVNNEVALKDAVSGVLLKELFLLCIYFDIIKIQDIVRETLIWFRYQKLDSFIGKERYKKLCIKNLTKIADGDKPPKRKKLILELVFRILEFPDYQKYITISPNRLLANIVRDYIPELWETKQLKNEGTNQGIQDTERTTILITVHQGEETKGGVQNYIMYFRTIKLIIFICSNFVQHKNVNYRDLIRFLNSDIDKFMERLIIPIILSTGYGLEGSKRLLKQVLEKRTSN